MTNIHIKKPKPMDPIMVMVTPGRRALGEQWSKVVVSPTPEGTYTVEREDTPAPADNTAIFVPGLNNLSIELMDYILEKQRKEAEYRVKNPLHQRAESDAEMINRWWFDYMDMKKKAFLGQTVSGPGGTTQRERL